MIIGKSIGTAIFGTCYDIIEDSEFLLTSCITNTNQILLVKRSLTIHELLYFVYLSLS